MKKKNILLLGAGPAQISTIETAKAMGLKTVVMDGNPEAEGLKVGDVRVAANFADPKKVIETAKKYEVNGILNVVTEVGVVSAAIASKELGLSCFSIETAMACTNKIVMRQKLKQGGVDVPLFKGTDKLSEAKAFAKEAGFPLIVKPAVGSGSRGVRQVNKLEDIESAVESARKISKDGMAILEGFIEGEEVSVECLTYKGHTEVMGISDKIRTKPPYRTDIKVSYPTSYDATTKANIISETKKAINAVGLENGITHTELLIKDQKARIVEIAARGGGFKIFDIMIPAISGVSAVKACINMALGQVPDITPKYRKASLLYFFKETPGKLKNIEGEKKVRDLPGIIELTLTIKSGEIIKEYTCGDDRIGWFIAKADDLSGLKRIEKEVESILKFNIE